MANVRIKVGYNFLYDTSGLLHIYWKTKERGQSNRKLNSSVPCKVIIRDSLKFEFWIPSKDSRFQVLDFALLVRGIWIPHSIVKRNSWFLELNPGFQSPCWIPDSTKTNLLDLPKVGRIGSPGSPYQNEVKCSAFDMEMIFHSMQIW